MRGWIVGVVLAVGCGAGSRSPAFDQASTLGPARPGRMIAASTCPDLAACRAECTNTPGAACTRAGDFAFATDTDAAERHWLRGCKAGDGAACERLMQVTGRDPKVSDAYAERACVYGVARACGMLGRSRAVRAMTMPDSYFRDDALLDAAAAFEAACGVDDWHACWDAAWIYRKTNKRGTRSIDSLESSADALAQNACNEGDADACVFRATRERKAGNDDAVTALFRRACGLSLGRSTKPAETINGSPFCAHLPRGAKVEPIALPPTSRWARWPGRRFLGSATRKMSFPPSYRLRLTKTLTVSFAYCVSPLGTVESLRIVGPSSSAVFNRDAFERTRTWRFTAASDGRSRCGTSTFTQHPTQ